MAREPGEVVALKAYDAAWSIVENETQWAMALARGRCSLDGQWRNKVLGNSLI
jgi:hypothetical protein